MEADCKKLPSHPGYSPWAGSTNMWQWFRLCTHTHTHTYSHKVSKSEHLPSSASACHAFKAHLSCNSHLNTDRCTAKAARETL